MELIAYNVEIIKGEHKGIKGITYATPEHNDSITIFAPQTGMEYYEKISNVKYGESFVSNKESDNLKIKNDVLTEVSYRDRELRIGDFPNTFAQQGWQCPICGRVYSPTTAMCFYCGNYKTVVTTDVKIGDGNTTYAYGVWQPPKSEEDNNERLERSSKQQ